MTIGDYFKEMTQIKDEMGRLEEIRDTRPSWGDGISGFIARAGFSVKLIFKEKELITFALLQWLCIAAGYYLWVQVIGWIPDSAWQHASHSDSATIGDVILFLWSFVCVGIVTFPLGLLTACMAAAVTAVWKEAYRGIVPDNFLNRMKPDRHEMIFRERIKDGKEFIAVLEDEAGEIAGMASGAKERYGRYDCELIAIYILPEYRRHGFGRQLFHTVTAHLAAQGFRSMTETTAVKTDFTVKIQATGKVEPENRVPIMPSVGGRIEEIFVNEGDRIKKGRVLAWLSSTERAALLDAVKINGSDPKELKRVKEAYNRMPLIAAIDGTIIKRSAEPGQTVEAGKEVLVISDRLIIKADVDETDIGGVRRGQRADFYLDAFPQDKYSGSIVSIAHDSSVKNNINVYEVKILPAGRIPVLRSGMTADVNIIAETKKDVLALPKKAVEYRDGEAYVKIKKDGGKLEDRKVKTGKSNDKYIEISSGLKDKETVMYSTKTATADSITITAN